ncbi:MAG: glycosyltransferase, partial [Bacteroidetes bacterium]
KKGWMPPHPTFYVKKEIYDKLGGFNLSYKIAADYDLLLRFLGKHKIRTTYLPEVLVKMRWGGTSNSSLTNIIQKSKEDYIALKENNIGGLGSLFLKNFRKLGQFF